MGGTAEAQRPLVLCRMNVGVAHSEVNPNTRVMSSRGIWLAYVISVAALHVILLSIPFFSIPVVWTLTNVIHNLVSRSLPGPQCRRLSAVSALPCWALRLVPRCGKCWGSRNAPRPSPVGSPLLTEAPWAGKQL